MKTMKRVVQKSARRLGLGRVSRVCARALVFLFAFTCVAVFIDKLVFVGMTTLAWIVGAGALVCVAVVVVRSQKLWPSFQEAAIEVDERLRLSERISSALAVAHMNEPMAQAVVADARSYARSIPVAETFPLTFPREFYGALLLAAVSLALLAWMPQFDLLSRRLKLRLAQEEAAEVREVAQQMRTELSRRRERLQRLGLEEPGEIEQMEVVIGEIEEGRLDRADAMATLNELAEQLRDAQREAAARNPVTEAMARRTGLDRTEDLAASLERREFEEAAQEIERLAEEAASGGLSEEQMAELASELNRLAEALSDTGGTMSGDTEALSEALAQLAAALQEGDADATSEALAQAQDALIDMDTLQDEIEMLAEYASLCESGGRCLGRGESLATSDMTGVFSEGDSRRRGPGMGGPGIGRGGIAPDEEEDVQFEPDRIAGRIRPGRVMGSFFVDGTQVRGEARVEFVETVESAQMEAQDAINRGRIPRAYVDLVHDYFESMQTE